MKPKAPLYVLAHGIEVIGEYKPTPKNPYWRVRIRPHQFFPEVAPRAGGISVRRSRVLLAAKLGRPLTPSEIAHHADEDKGHDVADNLELLTPAAHNRHHKTGTRHTDESKGRISQSLKRAIAEGRRAPPPRIDWTGRTHTAESRQRISETRKALIATGAIACPKPPSNKGKKLSKATKEKMRQAKLNYWKDKKGLPL